MLEIVVQYASAAVWPGLARDLWLLYSLGADVRLTFGELLTLLRAETGVKYHPTRDARGRRVAHVAHWSLARRMLRRTLGEARPGDLRDAEPGFFVWLEALVGMPEEELEPLLSLVPRWPLPATARVLERWAAAPTVREMLLGGPSHSREFRRRAAEAAAEMRAALGEGAEIVPAVPPRGGGSEPAAAIRLHGGDDEAAPAVLDASECASKRHL